MPKEKREHKWRLFKMPDLLICDVKGCDTVAKLDDVLKNTRKEAATAAVVAKMGSLLFNRELKKPAHDREYHWVLSQNGVASPLINQQEKLL